MDQDACNAAESGSYSMHIMIPKTVGAYVGAYICMLVARFKTSLPRVSMETRLEYRTSLQDMLMSTFGSDAHLYFI